MQAGNLSISGSIAAIKISGTRPASVLWKIHNLARPSYLFGWLAVLFAKSVALLTGIPTMTAELRAVRVDGASGQREDYGVVSRRVVTTAFVNFVVDQLQTETAVFGDFKYHDSGVGVTAENAGDTAMETTDGEARVAGTQTESAANAYRSVGTIAYTTTKAITEHGLFNDLTAGTLMDRSVFAAINVINGDSIEFTYTLTVNSGG